MDSLYEKLEKYSNGDTYPFHMPGHKRNTLLFNKSYSIDITEIDGFDDLNHPCTVLKDAMDEMTEYYNTDKTYILANGSTCGILASICAMCKPGDKILMARNCHKSVYNAVLLHQLIPVYISPKLADNGEFLSCVDVNAIKSAILENQGIRAVIITSPTYEGVISDVKSIADFLHESSIPLIVDEAHGAHLNFYKDSPTSAISLGADIVIQSLHKTLPALTQTALLHVKSKLISYEKVEKYIQIFQSSSPSYILIASAIECFKYMKENSEVIMPDYYKRLRALRDKISFLPSIKLYDGLKDGAFAYDISKLVIFPINMTGYTLAENLRSLKVECEMSCRSCVIAMTSVCDTDSGFEKLYNALLKLSLNTTSMKQDTPIKNNLLKIPEMVMIPYKAYTSNKACFPYRDAVGNISGETLYLYPPGIPIITLGERISREIIDLLSSYELNGLTVKGDNHTDGIIKCIL